MTQVAQGGTYTFTATVRDGNGDLADCDDLTLTIADPDGDELAGFPVSDPDIVRDGLGEYHFAWEVSGVATLGVYDADWAGTVDGLAIGGSDSIEVVLAGSISEFLAYATLADVQRELSKAETDERAITRIETALVNATDKLIQEIGFDFFRSPTSGTGTWYAQAGRDGILHIHSGFVSVTQIRVRSGRESDWETLETTAYDLEAWAAADHDQAISTLEPYDHIRLNGTSLIRAAFPHGRKLIELTGIRGWPAVPRKAIDANVDWARQDIAADRTFPGGVQVPSETGFPPQRLPLPDSVIRLRQWALYRYSCDT